MGPPCPAVWATKTPTASAGAELISHFLSQVSTSQEVPQSLILILKTTFLPSLMQQFSNLCCTALFSPIQLNQNQSWCSQVPLTQPTASQSRKIVLKLPELLSYLATVWEKVLLTCWAEALTTSQSSSWYPFCG